MDYSYTQTQQEDHPQYQQYHHQQQQQLQQQQQQSHDPSTIQAYDHSYQAYYPYNHQQYDPHQQYTYYNSTTTAQDYTNSYETTTSQRQFHQEPTSIHPPGVPIPPEPPQNADPEQTHLQNAYYAHGVAEDQQQQMNSGSGSGGLKPAAIAALSQLAQLSGNIEAAQRAIQQPIGQTPYRGGGRRGNRPFRGGGRGHFGYHGSRPDGSAPPFRGRGRGQGGGRHFSLYGAASTNTNSASVPAEGAAALMQPPSALVPGQAPLPVPTQVSSASFWRPPRMAWCELCRVDCNTPEILEQHKNGKRHKKNMQVHEELQKQRNKVNTEQQNAQVPNTELKPEVGHPALQQNLTSVVVTDDNRNETDQKDSAVNSEASAQPENKFRDQFAGRGRGSKRKMRGGRGGKYMRTSDGSRRPIEPPKQVIPFICEVCNVKCESQVVFDSHLSGKKHLATLKRLHNHRALCGEVGLQSLYPSNFNAASTSAAPNVQQGVNDPQALLAQLLMTYVFSQTQAQGTAPPTGPASADTVSAVAQALGSQLMSQDGSQNAIMMEVKSQLQSLLAYSEAPAAGNADTTNTGNETSAVAPSSNPIASEQAPGTETYTEDEVASSNTLVQPEPAENQMHFHSTFADTTNRGNETSAVAPAENPITSDQVPGTETDKEGEVASSYPQVQPTPAENRM